MADLSPPQAIGAAFGLRQSLDTVGAFAGPLIAMLVMSLSGNAYRLVFWLAAIPALLAVLLILLGVHEPTVHKAAATPERPSWGQLRGMPSAFWVVVGIAMLMTLARFSEGFLLLRAGSVGLPTALVPLVFVAMNLVYAASAYPVGRLSDRLGRRRLLQVGFAVLVLADAVLATAGGIGPVMAGVALWGLHMGMTQGLLASLVADAAPPTLRGTAFGAFNLATGIALLPASVIAGALWSSLGPAATFAGGAVFSTLALIALLAWRDRST